MYVSTTHRSRSTFVQNVAAYQKGEAILISNPKKPPTYTSKILFVVQLRGRPLFRAPGYFVLRLLHLFVLPRGRRKHFEFSADGYFSMRKVMSMEASDEEQQEKGYVLVTLRL